MPQTITHPFNSRSLGNLSLDVVIGIMRTLPDLAFAVFVRSVPCNQVLMHRDGAGIASFGNFPVHEKLFVLLVYMYLRNSLNLRTPQAGKCPDYKTGKKVFVRLRSSIQQFHNL